MNTMEINGFKATINYDPDIDMFRGEFLGLNGGADFYTKDIDGLHKEGDISLQVFLEMCEEEGIEPRKDVWKIQPSCSRKSSRRSCSPSRCCRQKPEPMAG